MIQLHDLSIVKGKSILTAQAKKTKPSLGYRARSYGEIISLPLWKLNQTRLPKGESLKFFINSITGGIS